LACSDAIGTASGQQPLGFEAVDGVVALPTPAAADHALQTTASADWPGGFRLFAKTGLLVRAGSSFELTFHGPESDVSALGWGSPADPVQLMRVGPCSSSAEWLAFAGGYFVNAVGCYTVTVQTPDRMTEVNVGIGAACPGQLPPVPPSDE
jgi:hypothetical protein